MSAQLQTPPVTCLLHHQEASCEQWPLGRKCLQQNIQDPLSTCNQSLLGWDFQESVATTQGRQYNTES